MKPWVQSPAVHKSVVVMPACNLVTWGGARRSEANLERDLISEREQENHLGDSLSEQWMADPHDFQVSSLSLDAPGMCCLYALILLPIFQSSCDPCTCLDFTSSFATVPWDMVIREVHVARSSPQTPPPLSSALMFTLLQECRAGLYFIADHSCPHISLAGPLLHAWSRVWLPPHLFL